MTRTGLNGMRETPKHSPQRQINDLREELNTLRSQVKTGFIAMEESAHSLNKQAGELWSYLWGTIEALKVEGKLDFLSKPSIDRFKDVVEARWKSEALEMIKISLAVGQGVCVRCHHVDTVHNFNLRANGASDQYPACPNCKASNTVFLGAVPEVSEDNTGFTGPMGMES